MLVECSGSRTRASVRMPSASVYFLCSRRSRDFRVSSWTFWRLACAGESASAGLVVWVEGLEAGRGAGAARVRGARKRMRADTRILGFTKDSTRDGRGMFREVGLGLFDGVGLFVDR